MVFIVLSRQFIRTSDTATEKSSQELEPTLLLGRLLLHARTSRARALGAALLALGLRRDGLDLRRAPLDQHRVAANVLALHLLGRLEVVVAVGEADEAVP